MRIYYETVDQEHYIELCLSYREASELLEDWEVISKECLFEGRNFCFGVRLITDEESVEDEG